MEKAAPCGFFPSTITCGKVSNLNLLNFDDFGLTSTFVKPFDIALEVIHIQCLMPLYKEMYSFG